MKVLLCGDFGTDELHAWQRALREALPEVEWLDLADARAAPETVDAAVVANPAPGSLTGLPGLRLVQSLWAGVDRLVGDATLPDGVPIARMVDPVMNAAMAETALWATIALHRGFFACARDQAAARWVQRPQRRAASVHVVVLGLGQMGGAVAERIAATGYRVSGWRLGARPAAALAGVEVCAGAAALHALLPGAQIVVNLLPLTAATEGLLDAAFFAALPRGAAIVNLARGAHVVDADLIDALDRAHLEHAVLDVFRTEPLPRSSVLWRHPRVTVLPHVAALTDIDSAAAVVADNLRALRDGRPIRHLVDRTRGY